MELRWARLSGPYEGDAEAIVADSRGYLFVLENGRLLRSTDTGGPWVERPLPEDANWWLTVGPDDLLYVAGNTGLYSSGDLGDTWHSLPRPESRIAGIAVSPEGDLYVLPSFGGMPGLYSRAVLYRSTDEGRTWVRLAFGGEVSSPPRAVVFDGDGLVYVAADHSIFVSRDGGDTWEAFSEFDGWIDTITSTAGDELFVVLTSGEFWAYGLVEGVARWSRGSEVGRGVHLQSMHVATDDRIWVAMRDCLLVSDDDGQAWRRAAIGYDHFAGIAEGRSGAMFCALQDEGIIRSLDGSQWTQVGLATREVWAVAVDSSGNIHVGAFVSADDGASWRKVAVPMAQAIAVAAGGQVYVAGGGFGEVYGSADNGQTWTQAGHRFRSETIAVNAEGHVYIGNHHDGVWRSVDEGVTWEKVFDTDTWLRGLFVTKAGHLFAGTADATSRSVDGGETWHAIESEEMRNVRCMAETEGEALLAGVHQRGILRSMDDGVTWTQTDIDGESIRVILPLRGMLLAGEWRNGGLYASWDDGVSWSATGLNRYVLSLTLDTDGTVLAGTRSGIYRGRLD